MVGAQGNIGLGLSGKTLASGSQARFWRQGPQPAERTRPDGFGLFGVSGGRCGSTRNHPASLRLSHDRPVADEAAEARVCLSVRHAGRMRLSVRVTIQSASFREGNTLRVRFSVRRRAQSALFREVKLKPRFADPRATRPAGWRAVARAHLPSWAIFHSAPQAGGRLPHTSRAPRRDGKAQSVRSGDRRVRFSVRASARMRLSVECAFPYLGKRGAVSRKGALCARSLTEKRILHTNR